MAVKVERIDYSQMENREKYQDIIMQYYDHPPLVYTRSYGWHGMYAMSGIQESNGRIYKVDDSLNLFVAHAISAARQFISDRRMLNHEWNA